MADWIYALGPNLFKLDEYVWYYPPPLGRGPPKIYKVVRIPTIYMLTYDLMGSDGNGVTIDATWLSADDKAKHMEVLLYF